MSTDSTRPQIKCDICNGGGLVVVYHRRYAGNPTVFVESVDGYGEVKTYRMPGTVSAHCLCSLGQWFRSSTPEKDRARIKDLADVVANRTWYQFDDPTADDEPELSPSAQRFLTQWKARFKILKGVHA